MPTPTNTLDPYATLLFDGVQLRFSEKFDEAIAKFSEAIKMDPNDPSGYIQRGITYSNVGKQDEAIADFNFAINYDPANADAYNGRGNAWAQKEQYEQAIKDYTKAMELQPALVKAYSNRAIAYINQQNIPQALVDFSKVIELTPDDAQAYFNRGQAYMTALQSVSDTSYVDLCIADFNQAIALSPDLAASYYLRGTCTGYKDDSASMFVDYSKAIELDPAQGKYYLFRAVLYPKAGTLDQALADAQKVLELTTDPEMITAAEQLIKELPTLPTLTPGPSPTPGS
jgi:tetratricopeptide (TPR) repeat protein